MKTSKKDEAQLRLGAVELALIAEIKVSQGEEKKQAHGVYADWLEEQGGRELEAAEQRAAAGLSEMRYYAVINDRRITRKYARARDCCRAVTELLRRYKWCREAEQTIPYCTERIKRDWPGIPRKDIRANKVVILAEEFRARLVGKIPYQGPKGKK